MNNEIVNGQIVLMKMVKCSAPAEWKDRVIMIDVPDKVLPGALVTVEMTPYDVKLKTYQNPSASPSPDASPSA